MTPRWALAPGAVAAGRDITGPVTIVTVTPPGDPLAAELPSQPLMRNLGRRLDLGRFTGRDRILHDIDAITSGAGSGYVIVRAEAGVGKSADRAGGGRP